MTYTQMIFEAADICASRAERFASFLDETPIYSKTKRGIEYNDAPTALRLFAEMLRDDFRKTLLPSANERKNDL